MTENNEHLNKPLGDESTAIDGGNSSFLVLYNDEIHTFEYVIDSLVEVCEHDEVQAEQCTMIAHYKGKCDVRKGSPEYLRPMMEGLTSRGLVATIDQ